MNYLKAIKLGLKLLKESKKQRGPVFGDNPLTYGVEDPGLREYHRNLGVKEVKTETYFPKEGGTFTRVSGEAEPFPGHPDEDTVSGIAQFKRMLPAAIDAYYPFIEKYCLKPEKYCKCAREVYRLFNVMISKETSIKHIERWAKVRDIVCIVLEFDNAYRFRAQDMIVEARMDELKMTKGDLYWAEKTKGYKYGPLKL